MTRFILSHHKLAFPHILQHQLCIKIPHLPFWALAAVEKEPRRSSSRVAGGSDYFCVAQRIINCATFSLLLYICGCRKSNYSPRGYLKVQGVFFFKLFTVLSPLLSLFTSTVIEYFCPHCFCNSRRTAQKSANFHV